jgi:OmpR-family two-component system manganese-sensing sensor histidine kinase
LAIAKVIVDTHRGHIHLDSQPGEGTVVAVVLPQGGVGG